MRPDWKVWRLVQLLVLLKVGKQVVPMEKQPEVREMPLPYKVEVAAVKFAMLLMERKIGRAHV